MIARENINSFWASLIIEELVRNGVELFCISPGSRSTPLTVAAARHADAECFVCHDERAAAFLALGYGKAAGRPAALICTSGTAAANYFPAIIEASMDDAPLIVLTADRPPELLDTAANQTINQSLLYGDYTRWRRTLPSPDENVTPRFVLTTVDQAVHRATAIPPGPVHLNCQFREPLAPTTKEFVEQKDARLIRWEKGKMPLTSYKSTIPISRNEDIHHIAELINTCDNGLVILGRMKTSSQQNPEIGALLSALGWPVYADIASGFRLGPQDWPVVDDLMLETQKGLKSVQPDIVFHLGGALLSTKLQRHLKASQLEHYILVHENPKRIDPDHIITTRLQHDVSQFCAQLCPDLIEKQKSNLSDARLAHKRVNQCLTSNTITESGVARVLSQHLPVEHGLFLGNSMPIRDMSEFAILDGASHAVGTNRGASGIDGIVASAVGYAYGLKKPVTALIGDVAFLHDLNSLNLMHNAPFPVTLICFNNNGGDIFSRLPIAKHKDVFESFFTTPHNLSFEHAAKMFNLPWMRPGTIAHLISVLSKTWSSKKPSIIELNTSNRENALWRFELQHILNKEDSAT